MTYNLNRYTARTKWSRWFTLFDSYRYQLCLYREPTELLSRDRYVYARTYAKLRKQAPWLPEEEPEFVRTPFWNQERAVEAGSGERDYKRSRDVFDNLFT